MLTLQPPNDQVSVDYVHAALLMGARKPERVLELGFGAGYTTTAILNAIDWNGFGDLTIVDNWHDGREPVELTATFRRRHATFITSDERDFTKSAASESYDIIVADADHRHSDQWCTDHIRIATRGGILFWHDTANPDFPNLANINKEIAHLPHYHFRRSTHGSTNDVSEVGSWRSNSGKFSRMAV